MGNSKTDNDSLLAFEFDSEEPGKPLIEYVRGLLSKGELLWLHKWSLIVTATVGFAIAVGISLLLPARFMATAYFLPPEMGPTSGLDLLIGMKTGGAMMGSSVGNMLNSVLGTNTPGQLYIQEMQSRPVEDELIKRFDLKRVYRSKSLEATRKILEGSTKFDENRKSGIISVIVTDKDPTRAAALANGYAEELGQFLADLGSDSGRREREFFEAQLKISREQLKQSSNALSDFSSKHSALNLPLQSTAIISSTSAVEGRMIAAQAQLNGLLSIYTENNIRVKQARAQIAELQYQLSQMQGKAPSSTATVSAKPGEASKANGSSSKMQQISELSTEYMDLYRAAKIDETMVETLTQQYEISRLEETRHVSRIQLLDPAQTPERKSFPKRRQLSIIGMLLGFLIGVGYVLARSWWQNTSDDNEWKHLLCPIVSKFSKQELRK